MSSSRIFITGLPPTISEEEFKKHFSQDQPITDARLIAARRIGYVGYKTPEEAQNAVKYFNKSFIRMSKIGVEIARPVRDMTLQKSRKQQREDAILARKEAVAVQESAVSNTKRKREEPEPVDSKLQEFLSVMQAPSKIKKWAAEGIAVGNEEPPTKIQAIEASKAESDDEYEVIPKKAKQAEPKNKSSPQPVPIPAQDSRPDEQSPAEEAVPNPAVAINPALAIDDDWLRSKTSRLLDLMEPEEMKEQARKSQPVGDEYKVDFDQPTAECDIAENSEKDGEMALVAQEPKRDQVMQEALDPILHEILANGRLFIRNLPYSTTEDDLREHFSKYGTLEEVHLPLDASGRSKGFVYVQYQDHSAAAEAYHNVDGEPFQGRLLHVIPAAAKRENKLDEFTLAKLPLKRQKQLKKKAEAGSTTFNWNSLYMNQDAVNTSVAERLGVSKSELFVATSSEAAVKQAVAETAIIQETKSYFTNNGVDLHAFNRKERGDTVILVKNFPYGMTLEELRKMFEEFGQVLRVLMPPTGTIAIVEFAQVPQARKAFGSLAYRRVQDSVLFLEKAPKDVFKQVSTNSEVVTSSTFDKGAADLRPSAADLLVREDDIDGSDTSTLYVRNLNFTTTSGRLAEIFKPLDGFSSARVNTKTDPKRPGQVLSMGFGFLEFRSKAQALAALAAMDGYELDGHRLVIKASHKGADAAEERRKGDRSKKLANKSTKIIIKNLPFEASKKDVRALFGTYGQLRSVRVPKKFDNSTRGFAFAEFVTAREAENAVQSLKDSHLLGRRLVLEFATDDPVDAEDEIEKMQKKVGSQRNKVALQKLTGGGRQKINIDDNDAEED